MVVKIVDFLNIAMAFEYKIKWQLDILLIPTLFKFHLVVAGCGWKVTQGQHKGWHTSLHLQWWYYNMPGDVWLISSWVLLYRYDLVGDESKNILSHGFIPMQLQVSTVRVLVEQPFMVHSSKTQISSRFL